MKLPFNSKMAVLFLSRSHHLETDGVVKRNGGSGGDGGGGRDGDRAQT
jgi:hypothetical protein